MISAAPCDHRNGWYVCDVCELRQKCSAPAELRDRTLDRLPDDRERRTLLCGAGRRDDHHQGCAAAVEAPPGITVNMARTGRTSLLATAFALLGLQQGAWALPSSKVAFAQHGLAEGEDAVMHAPPAGSSRLSAITPQLLASAIARVMSLDARAEVDTGLPAGDIFNRPDANVLVFVDGLRPTAGAGGC